ncbi:Low affinity sulfate transporter 3 [Nymphaea thermarum]|nr:Low affinity sulfate transporter 3 [Nymphaea thermarum]
MNSLGLDASSTGESRRAEPTLRPDDFISAIPDPPSPWKELMGSFKHFIFPYGSFSAFKKQPVSGHFLSAMKRLFPILVWLRNYDLKLFRRDLLAGLTLASLSIPQSIGYANLAKLDPQYGLYTSFVPPLIYAAMGSSREIAIGPVAVVSMLLSSLVQKVIDPYENPSGYRKLVFTSTFFAGLFQLIFGFLRLGFIIDFLSHAAIVGFMGGAAIMIGLQQLKGLLGLPHFTNKTDAVSVVRAVLSSLGHDQWRPYSFFIGSTFLILILVARYLVKRNKKYFWVAAIAPLISVILSTIIVFLSKAEEHGVVTKACLLEYLKVKYVKGGINPSSITQLSFGRPYVSEAAKIGLVSAIIALTEAIAVGRSFAAINGYHLDGNTEMVAMGTTNIVGSMTSCYVATGSFSRTAVNFSAGCRTAMSNVVMSFTVLLSMVLLTRFLYYTPISILASIILSSLPGLIDIAETIRIFKIDKLDFLACIGAFIGVIFASVEIGLLVAVSISLGKILLGSTRPRIDILGQVPGTNFFCNTKQYPFALKLQGVVVIRINTAFLCFFNARYTEERIMRWVEDGELTGGKCLQALVLDMSNITSIDSNGIVTLEELHKRLASLKIQASSQGPNGGSCLQLALANPGWEVIHKLKLAKVVDKVGGEWIFLSVAEAVDACFSTKKTMDCNPNLEKLMKS